MRIGGSSGCVALLGRESWFKTGLGQGLPGGEYIGVCGWESALFEEGGGGDHCMSELFREEYC